MATEIIALTPGSGRRPPLIHTVRLEAKSAGAWIPVPLQDISQTSQDGSRVTASVDVVTLGSLIRGEDGEPGEGAREATIRLLACTKAQGDGEWGQDGRARVVTNAFVDGRKLPQSWKDPGEEAVIDSYEDRKGTEKPLTIGWVDYQERQLDPAHYDAVRRVYGEMGTIKLRVNVWRRAGERMVKARKPAKKTAAARTPPAGDAPAAAPDAKMDAEPLRAMRSRGIVPKKGMKHSPYASARFDDGDSADEEPAVPAGDVPGAATEPEPAADSPAGTNPNAGPDGHAPPKVKVSVGYTSNCLASFAIYYGREPPAPRIKLGMPQGVQEVEGVLVIED